MALVLIPAAWAATVTAIDLLSKATEWPVRWPLAIPVLTPGIILAFAWWAYLPSLRGVASPTIVGGVAFGALVLLSLAPWPLLRERGQIRRAGPGELQAIRAAKRAKLSGGALAAEQQEFQSLEADAPLYSWLPFTEPHHPLRERSLAAIQRLPERQREVEEMVRSGNVAALREVPNFNVEATPALCEAASETITFHSRRVLPETKSPPYAPYARDVEFYMPTIEWLVARGCKLDNALTQLETTARVFGDDAERQRFTTRIDALRRGPR